MAKILIYKNAPYDIITGAEKSPISPKAILIVFDGNSIWFPKAWILRIRRDKHACAISIKISEYRWAKKI